jgi:hypothetical protein
MKDDHDTGEAKKSTAGAMRRVTLEQARKMKGRSNRRDSRRSNAQRKNGVAGTKIRPLPRAECQEGRRRGSDLIAQGFDCADGSPSAARNVALG